MEDRFGYPFVHAAPTGSLLNMLLDRYAKLARSACYLTNVYKSHIIGDEDPTDEQIRDHAWMLEAELYQVKPKFIIALGRFASHFFMSRSYDVEMAHGLPFRESIEVTSFDGHKYNHECTVIPCYHPAAGLHNSNKLQNVVEDFKAIRRILDGELSRPIDEYPKTDYRLIDDPDVILNTCRAHNYIAVDSEGYTHDPYMYQFSVKPGEAYAFFAKNKDCCKALEESLLNSVTVFHNALHDLGCFATSNIRLGRFLDTMVMSYLTGINPQGLKPLSFRLCGMEMMSYTDVIDPFEQEYTTEYIGQLAKEYWPPTPVYVEMEFGEWKLRRPWSLNRRLDSILLGIAKGKTNIRKLWSNAVDAIPPKVIRAVYDRFGPMPDVGLDKVEPQEKAIDYACRDADATGRDRPILQDQIELKKLQRVCDLDHAVLPMIARMQKVGIRVKPGYFEPMSIELQKEMDEISESIFQISGHYINPGSGDQVAKLLYEHMGLPIIKRTKAGDRGQVGEDILKTLQQRVQDDDALKVIQHVVDYKEREKIKGTYCDKLPFWTHRDGRIRPNYRVTRIPSGRLAASDPNLLAQPTRSVLGKKIRRGFIPEDGFEFTTVDLSQIELRVLAHLSQDPVLLQVFREGLDLHDRTERSLFGTSKVNRIPAKTCNFGIIYGLTAQGLKLQLMKEGIDKTVEECQEMIDGWFDTYLGVRDYFDECVSFTKQHGFIRDMWGRMRYLPLIYSPDEYKAAEAERQACNHVVQSGAQGIMKMCMRDVWENVLPFFWGGMWDMKIEPLLQIHDELLFEHEEGYGESVRVQVIEAFENAVELDVPVLADGSTDTNWGDLK
jgi:uracil-DNA glycosylase family 4